MPINKLDVQTIKYGAMMDLCVVGAMLVGDSCQCVTRHSKLW